MAGVDCFDIVVRGPASAYLSGADGDVNFAGDVAVGVAFPAVLAGVVRHPRPLLGWRLWPTLLGVSPPE